MKSLFFTLLAVVLLLSSCTPPTISVVPTSTKVPPTPTIVPFDLSSPMQVGSTFTYLDGSTLVAVPSGPFLMGHGTADNPEHTVTLSDYWIYSTKVTNGQYALCEAQGQCSTPDKTDNLNYSNFASQNDPVVGVTFDQAMSYCNYVNGSLPTEAQWEKAARGPNGSLYPWGNDLPTCDLLNFNNCVHNATDVLKYPKGRSTYGALDMEGNVFEWTADWYDPLYYKVSPPGDPPGPDSGKARVIRSSSYTSNATQTLAYARFFASPGDHRRDLGFRCVIKDTSYFAPACQLASVVKNLDASTVNADCPNISIDVKVTACRFGGGALVTFNDDHPRDPNASFGGILGCTLVSGTPGTYPIQYKCTTGSTAVLSSSCSYAGITNATCGPHYNLNPSTGLCEWDGSRTTGLECTAGDFYDPVHHCCLTATGSIIDNPVCPLGTVFTKDSPDHYVCLPSGNSSNVATQTASINPPDCPGTCKLTALDCSQRNLVFCDNTCSCLSVGIKCPTH
jgi:formylglycine-generating enzyme required for sulfatase activity